MRRKILMLTAAALAFAPAAGIGYHHSGDENTRQRGDQD